MILLVLKVSNIDYPEGDNDIRYVNDDHALSSLSVLEPGTLPTLISVYTFIFHNFQSLRYVSSNPPLSSKQKLDLKLNQEPSRESKESRHR